MLEDGLFDFGRVDVLASGLDQLLLRLAPGIEEVAVRVEAAEIAGVMAAVAEGVGIIIGKVPVALEDGGPETVISPVSPVATGLSSSSTRSTSARCTALPADPGRSS